MRLLFLMFVTAVCVIPFRHEVKSGILMPQNNETVQTSVSQTRGLNLFLT